MPNELPEAFATGVATADRQLNALWIALDRANDARVAVRFVDTLFGVAE